MNPASPAIGKTSDLPSAASSELGTTLPASWYFQPEVFKLEMEYIFKTSWNYLGRVDQLPKTGDYFSTHWGGIPVLVLRDEEGKIRAYYNVCKHRGAEIIPPGSSGNRRTLQCQYHAWTYSLDGSLKGAPKTDALFGTHSCVQKSDYSLIPIRTEVFGPLIFGNLNPTATGFSEVLGDLPMRLKSNRTQTEGLQFRGRTQHSLKCNWKIVVENYLECYHCPVAHPSFSKVIDLSDYEIDLNPWNSIQRGASKSDGTSPRHENESIDGIYAYLWPGFMLNTYPGPNVLSMNYVFPVDERNTLLIFEFFSDPKMPEEEVTKTMAFINEVQAEDTALCESVQRGLASGVIPHGKLVLSQELGIHHFQKLVSRELSKQLPQFV